MTTEQKILNMLGLAKRSRNLVSGTNTLKLSLRKVKLIIVSDDISDNSFKEVEFLATQNEIKMISFNNSEALGMAIGKEMTKVIGITDIGFSKKILELYNKGE